MLPRRCRDWAAAPPSRVDLARVAPRYAHVSRAEKGIGQNVINLKERERFQKGQKLIAILSDAGATGVSLHADKGAGNQRRRLHIVPELGFSASKIVQVYFNFWLSTNCSWSGRTFIRMMRSPRISPSSLSPPNTYR